METMEVLLIIFFGLTIYLSIVIVLRHTGAKLDAVKRRLDYISNTSKAAFIMDEELSKPLFDRFIKPVIKSLGDILFKSKKHSNENSTKARNANKLKKMLIQAGFSLSTAEYGIIRLMIIVFLAIAFFVLALVLQMKFANALLFSFIGMFFGYAGTRFHLTKSISKRKKLMEDQLPDVLDLLSVSVEAGLGFDQAINHITNNMEGPLIDEFVVTYREMTMGRTRKDALSLLGERCDIEEIKSFVGALAQAAQLGISMKNVLRSQSAAMRQSRKAKVQEKAMKISIKILLPMIGFIFPVIFIILLGPAIVNAIEVFKK